MTAITISGIISGLDTTSIIDKLVAVEGNSKTLLTNQQVAQKSIVTAYTAMLSSIGTLGTQVSALADTSSWSTTTAASSSSTVTAATTATGKSATSLTFDVTAVAAAHALISDSTVNSTSTTVASGPLTLTDSNGDAQSIDVGTGSLSDVVSAINAANAGVTASAVQTSPGEYRLQVAATSTGAASAFTLDGIDSGLTMNLLATGTDAAIKVGTDSADGTSSSYTVKSATNAFTGVTDGLSFTVSKIETGVTVSSAVDPTAVSDEIASIVTNANNLLASIASNTAWDNTTKTGGALLGDSTVRSLQQSILSIAASANTPGLSVTASGQLAYDAATFKTAFAANPASVMSAYGASSTFTPTAGVTGTANYTNALSGTLAGTYAVNVTNNAKFEQWQPVPPGTGLVGRLMTISRGTTTVSYQATAADDNTSAAAAFNTKLAQAKLGISATVGADGGMVLTATNAGTANAFTFAVDGGVATAQTVAGANIAGTIDGVAATGIANLLSLPASADSGAAGITVAVNVLDSQVASSGGAIGSITYAPGFAQQLDSLFAQMSDSATGQMVTAQAAATAQIKTLQTQVDNWTTRLDSYRAMLNAKFTAMETALSTLKTQSDALSSFFGTTSSSSSSSTSSSS